MNRYATWAWLLLVAVCAATVIGGCSQSPTASSGKKRSYGVRGEIVQLPGRDSVDHAMLVRHEAIKDFTDAQGKEVGMMSMTMPFPVGAGVSLDGLEVGDKIEFIFTMDWNAPKGSEPYEITRIKKLPADTKLELGMAMEPSMKKADAPDMTTDEHDGH